MVYFGWPTGFDVAEAARTGAGVPQNHDCCGPAVPAFPHVRAGRFFADRMQAIGVHNFTKTLVPRPARDPGPEPVRFAAQMKLVILGVVQHHAAESHLHPASVFGGISPKRPGVPGQCSILGRIAHDGDILPPQNLVNRIPSAR